MRTTTTTGLLLATSLATLAMMQPAMAQSQVDAQAFVDRIAALYALGGYDITFGDATADGDTVTVDGLTAVISGMEEEPITIDTELTFNGVVATDDGGFTAESMTVPDVDTEFSQDPVGHITVSDLIVEDIHLPPEDGINTLALMEAIGGMSSGPLLVTRDGADFFSVESMSAVNTFTYTADNTLENADSVVTVDGIWADLSSVSEDDPQAGAVINALGLTEVNGNVVFDMAWNLTDGHMIFNDLLFNFDDIGAINFKLDLTGFTAAVLDKIYAAQSSDVDPTSEEGQAQQMMLGMELLQAITINSTSLRYDDAGIAPKLIDLFAEQSGVDRAQFVEALKAQVPAMVGQAGVPALTDLVVPEVNAFLDDPKSLEVSIKPATPTTLLVLSAAAANPAGLISAAGLSVKANQPAAE